VPAQIYGCNCSHEFQDKRYGKGQRVHSEAGKGTKLRCTVCSKEKTILVK